MSICFANNNSLPPLSLPLMSNLKNSTEYFVGRREFLKNMHEFLFNKDNSDKNKNDSLVISGTAGSGKTQVIIRYAELHKTNYQIIWWFDLKKDLNEQYKNFAKKWNKVIDKHYKNQKEQNFLQINLDPTNATHIKEEVYDRLRTTDFNWLIILDNAKESATTLTDIPKNEGKGYGHVIASTQNSTHNPNVMHLDKLTREESVELLLKITGENDTHNANTLAHTLNDYPLAVSRVGSFIAYHTAINMAEYNQLFLTNRQELWEAENQLRMKMAEFDSYKNTVFTNFSMIINEVKKESALAYELLAISSFLDNENIPENILKQYVKNEYGQRSVDIEFKNALSILMKYSLLNHNCFQFKKTEHTGDEYISHTNKLHANNNQMPLFYTHELIQLVMQDLLTNQEKHNYLNKAITATNELLPNNIYALTDLVSKNSYLSAHINFLIQNASDLKLYNNNLIWLMLRSLEYNLTVLRNDLEAQKLINKIEETKKLKDNCNKHHDNQDKFLEMRFAVMKNIFLAWVKADYSASLKQALLAYNLMQEQQQTSSQVASLEDQLMIYTRLARMYNMMGDNTLAAKYAELAKQVIQENSDLFGYKQDFFVSLAKINLDIGDYEQALKYYNLLTYINNTNHSVNNNSEQEILPSNLSVFLIKADILIGLGKHKEAMEKFKILKKIADQLPEDNFYKASVSMYYSYVSALLGSDLTQAIKTSIAGQEMLKKFFGKEGYYKNRHSFISHKFLGKLYKKQGDYLKAEEQYSIALKILNNVYSQSSCATTDKLSNIYSKLAIINIKLQQPTEAFKYLKTHHQIFGVEHRRNIKLMKYFADNNVDVGLE